MPFNPDPAGPEDFEFVWRFGGGLNSRASETEIADREDAGGRNYQLDLENSHWKPRRGFDLIATAPNGGSIDGFAQLEKIDGTVSTLIQAGTTVYEWDGSTGFSSVGTVAAGTKMRGGLDANFTLSDLVIITDLAKAEVVKTWDGTTFATMVTGLGSSFYAKYCFVENERAFFANCKEAVALDHVLVGSKRGDNTVLSVSDRPSSAMSDEDPFFIPISDLRPINGLQIAFGELVLSTRRGRIYKLLGTSAQNYEIVPFYSGSFAVGDESMVYIGNDVAYGREGRIETISASQSLADVGVDDLSREISEDIEDVKEWRLVHDRRRHRLYCFPDSVSECWVFFKDLYDDIVVEVARRKQGDALSPWSRWTTTHPIGFQPATVWNMLHPTTKNMRVYMGDASGQIFELAGSGSSDDGNAIKSERLSKLLASPPGQEHDVEGWVVYRKDEAATLRLRFEHGGIAVFNQDIDITIPAASVSDVWGTGGGMYWGGGAFWGHPFRGRLVRQNYGAAGRSSQFQVRATIDGTKDFDVQEIGIRFKG